MHYQSLRSVVFLDENHSLENFDLSMKIDDRCLNKYVEANGKLYILQKNQLSYYYAQNLKYMHTIEKTNEINCVSSHK